MTTARSRSCSATSRPPATARSRPAKALFEKVKTELTVHEIIEEEIFYSELKAHPKAKAVAVLEGFEEHNVVDTLMGELEQPPVDHET